MKKTIVILLTAAVCAVAYAAGTGCYGSGTKNCDNPKQGTWVTCTFTPAPPAKSSTQYCWVSNQPTKVWATALTDPSQYGLDGTESSGTCSWNCYYIDGAGAKQSGTCSNTESGSAPTGNSCNG